MAMFLLSKKVPFCYIASVPRSWYRREIAIAYGIFVLVLHAFCDILCL